MDASALVWRVRRQVEVRGIWDCRNGRSPAQLFQQEALRIDPPVTSCTHVSKEMRASALFFQAFKESKIFKLSMQWFIGLSRTVFHFEVINFKGREYSLPENTLNQYTLSMANRDPSVFSDPDVFDPTRKDCAD